MRCINLAEALQQNYEIEIVGTTFGVGSKWGQGLWPPLVGYDAPIRSVSGDYLPGYIPHIRALLSLITGHVVIACKPRFPSFGVALIKRLLSGTPVILDVDDDERSMTEGGRNATWLRKLRDTNGFMYTRLVHPLCARADAVFSVSEHFRRTYGGVIVPHGRDPQIYDPSHYDGRATRQKLGIGDDDFVIGFIGTPHPHKGTDLLVSAATRTGNEHVRVMIVGAIPGDPYGQELQARFGNRVIFVPSQPLDRVPNYLAAADAVALPQRNLSESRGQMPSKLTEAMAMGKAVIASRVSDIPKYLDGCGLLVPPDDEPALADAIAAVANNRQTTTALGHKARIRFLQDMTYEAMLNTMRPVIDRLVMSSRRTSPFGRLRSSA